MKIFCFSLLPMAVESQDLSQAEKKYCCYNSNIDTRNKCFNKKRIKKLNTPSIFDIKN